MVSRPIPTPTQNLAERVTVVLLTYNCASRIEEVLRHLLDLDVPVIAVDNASTDGTADVVSRFDVELIRLPQNVGAAGRNAGAAAATTAYVAFCDDDGWYEREGLEAACDLMDAHPRLGLVNARILVGTQGRLDPISAEMSESPIPDRLGIPGAVLLSFMAGAVIVRRTAYQEVGGYDPRFFIGGEEETVGFPLAKAGWEMRYVPEVVVHHHPSLANAGNLRAYGMRNTLWTAWLHRRWLSALRYTAFTLADTPKNKDYLVGLRMAMAGLPWVLAERKPMSRQLDADLSTLDRRRYANRRPILTSSHPTPSRSKTTKPVGVG
ncbi:MAG TPA: glycosyltransferase [Propionibacteriaceae bacterium]|nr:glycosyltransferase [Propionibacteriaceae bacterium]